MSLALAQLSCGNRKPSPADLLTGFYQLAQVHKIHSLPHSKYCTCIEPIGFSVKFERGCIHRDLPRGSQGVLILSASTESGSALFSPTIFEKLASQPTSRIAKTGFKNKVHS